MKGESLKKNKKKLFKISWKCWGNLEIILKYVIILW